MLRLPFSLVVAWPLGGAAGAAVPVHEAPSATLAAAGRSDEAERVASFFEEFRASQGAKAHFEVAYIDGVRSAVAAKALKKGAVVARTPAAAVIGPAFSKGHTLLAEKCAAAGEGLCSSAVFAAAALWLCTCERLACRPYAQMLSTLAELQNFAGFADSHRSFARMLEPALADGWQQRFEQLRALAASSAPGLGKLGLLPPRSPGASDADESAHHGSLWWALGASSARAMILPEHMPGVGHVSTALFPALDMFNFHPNASLANAKYRGLELITTRRVAKGEQLRIAKDAKMAMSPLESLANQGFILEELMDGPEIQVDPNSVPYDAERSQRFGCEAVPGHFRRPRGGEESVWPAETLSCLHVMWYPPDDAVRALAAGHLRPAALPARPPEARERSGRKPSEKELKRWRRLDAEAWEYLGGLCRAGLEGARAALASPEARELAKEGGGFVSAALLRLGREHAEVYKRCGAELRAASGSAVGRRAPARRQGAEL